MIVWWARRHAGTSTAWTVRIAAILVAWLAAAVGLAMAGAFVPHVGAPPYIGIAVVAPIVIGIVALWGPSLRLPEASLTMLMGLQVMRIVGFEFVVGGRSGFLPA